MAKLAKLNNSLLRSVSRAALGADAPAEDENDVAQDEDEDTPPAGRRGRKAKKVSRRSGRVQDEDQDAEDEDGDDDLDAEDDLDPDAEDDDYDAEDEDPDAEDDLDPDAEDEDEDPNAEDEDPPASRRGGKARKSKASARGGRTANSGERARIAAITRSKLSAGREGLAEYLAFETGLSSRTALGILNHAPKSSSATTLRSRMASVENPRINATARGRDVSDEDRQVQSAVKTAQSFGF